MYIITTIHTPNNVPVFVSGEVLTNHTADGRQHYHIPFIDVFAGLGPNAKRSPLRPSWRGQAEVAILKAWLRRTNRR